MSKGIETKIPIQIYPNRQSLDPDYLFNCIFYRVRSTGNQEKEASEYSHKAKQIFEMMCQPGGLHDSEWTQICKDKELSQGEWQFIVKKLRASGMARKDGHIYRPKKAFLSHLQDMASSLHRYFMDLGIRI